MIMNKKLFAIVISAFLANTAFAIDATTKLPADAITIKDATGLVSALTKAEAGVCKDANGQVRPCTLNVYDLFCKETAGLAPSKDKKTMVPLKVEHFCTFTNEWTAKTENRSGAAADGIFKALKDARLKLSCGGLDGDYKSSCNTRMQNINCYASGVEPSGSPRVSCAIIPKYHSFVAAPPAKPADSNSAVIGDHHVKAKAPPHGVSEQGVPLDKKGYPTDGNWEISHEKPN